MELVSQNTTRKELAVKVLNNSFFYAASKLGIWVMDLLVGIILARYLVPADYSVFAMAIFYFSFFNRLEQLDLDNALMSTRENLNSARSTHFVMRIGLSNMVFVVTLFWMLTPWGGWPIGAMMLGLAFAGILESFTSTQRISFEIRFKASSLSWIEFSSMFFAMLAAIGSAILGWGYWALLVYKVTNLLSRTILIHLKSDVALKFYFDKKIATYYLKMFGLPVIISSVFTFFLQIQIPLIKTFDGADRLGFYLKAIESVLIPMAFLGLLIRVIAPLYSHYQNQKENLRETFYLLQLMKYKVAVPVFFLLFCFSTFWIKTLYGERWLPMNAIFKVLLLYSFFRLFFDDLLGMFSLGLKKPHYFRRLEILQGSLSLILAPAFIFYFGAVGAAWSLSLAVGISSIVGLRIICKKIELLFKPLLIPVCSSLMVSAVIYLLLTSHHLIQAKPGTSLVVLLLTLLSTSYIFESKSNKVYLHRIYALFKELILKRKGELIT